MYKLHTQQTSFCDGFIHRAVRVILTVLPVSFLLHVVPAGPVARSSSDSCFSLLTLSPLSSCQEPRSNHRQQRENRADTVKNIKDLSTVLPIILLHVCIQTLLSHRLKAELYSPSFYKFIQVQASLKTQEQTDILVLFILFCHSFTKVYQGHIKKKS